MNTAIQSKTGLPRYFSREAILLALIIAVLPNLFFLAVMPFYIAHRVLAPTLYLAAGLVSLVLPRWAAYGLFLAAAAFDIITIMMLAFNLPLDVTLQSARDLGTIDVAASAFYIGFIAVIAGIAVFAAVLLNQNRDSLRGASPVLAALTAFAFLGLNAAFNQPHLTKYEGPADGALLQTGLTADAIAERGNNLIIVMVEGLGAYADPKERALLKDRLTPLTETGKFTLQAGTTYYHGSTTGAASRELCGQWGDYVDYLGAEDYDCLPRQLAERGYETAAVHGFDIDMFRRDLWYPRIGFTALNFKDDLISEYGDALPSRCGSVFEGLCDVEVGTAVSAEIKRGDGPKMIYWLTLNSHIPFQPKASKPLACRSNTPAIDNVQVCQLTELFADVFDSVAALASDPTLPPTDFLVVGDHHTPLWQRAAKNKFIPNKVDWYLLKDARTREGELPKLSALPDETNL